jgi:hypothetical protein
MPIYWPAIEELEERNQPRDPWASFVARQPSATAAVTGDVAVPRGSSTPTDPNQPTDPNDPSNPSTPSTTQSPYRAETLAEQWMDYQPPAAAQPPAWQQSVIDGMLNPTADPRSTELYEQLHQRATQSLALDRNDPIIRAQADAYAAQEERARRDNLADLAERSGPNANLRGEQRLGYERMGQRVGGFEAELLGRELQARRDEIAQALQLSATFLSTEEQRALQREIALLDNAIAQQNAANSGAGLQQDWMEALMQNAQFLDDLEARERDRRSYYDLVQQGLL